MLKRGMMVLLLALGLASALAACGGGASAAPSGPMQQITVTASDFKLEPKTIEVTVGQKVQITYKNNGSVQHDFSIFNMPATGVKDRSSGSHPMGDSHGNPSAHVTATSGKSGTLEFTPTKEGSYDVYCTVEGHKDAGMRATLVVKAQ